MFVGHPAKQAPAALLPERAARWHRFRPLKREIRFSETFGIGLLACTNSTEA
jgi:hypothetical protein